MSSSPTSLEQALGQAIAKLRADSGTIHIAEPSRGVLLLAAQHGVPASLLPVIREIAWGKGLAGQAAQRAEPVRHCNIQSSQSPDIHGRARETGTAGAIVVPMMCGTEVVGTLGVGCREEREFTAREVQYLLDLGRTLGAEFGDDRLAA